MKEMADVMLEHRITRTGRCSCGDVLLDMSPERVAGHVAAALTAAGFCRVSDAQAGALTEAADELARMDRIAATPIRDVSESDELAYFAFEQQGSPELFLRARAATVRGRG